MSISGLIRKVLAEVGLHPDRFNLKWASAAEAPRFVKLITDYTATVKELGPLGAIENLSPEEAAGRAKKALEMVSDRKLRMGFGNLTKNLRQDVPGLTDEMVSQAIDEKLTKTISTLIG